MRLVAAFYPYKEHRVQGGACCRMPLMWDRRGHKDTLSAGLPLNVAPRVQDDWGRSPFSWATAGSGRPAFYHLPTDLTYNRRMRS